MNYLLKENMELNHVSTVIEQIFQEINPFYILNKMRCLEIGVGNGKNSIPWSQYFKSYYGIEKYLDVYNRFLEMKAFHHSNIQNVIKVTLLNRVFFFSVIIKLSFVKCF